MHPIALALGWWYSLPIVALDYLLVATLRLAALLIARLWSGHPPVTKRISAIEAHLAAMTQPA